MQYAVCSLRRYTYVSSSKPPPWQKLVEKLGKVVLPQETLEIPPRRRTFNWLCFRPSRPQLGPDHFRSTWTPAKTNDPHPKEEAKPSKPFGRRTLHTGARVLVRPHRRRWSMVGATLWQQWPSLGRKPLTVPSGSELCSSEHLNSLQGHPRPNFVGLVGLRRGTYDPSLGPVWTVVLETLNSGPRASCLLLNPTSPPQDPYQAM